MDAVDKGFLAEGLDDAADTDNRNAAFDAETWIESSAGNLCTLGNTDSDCQR